MITFSLYPTPYHHEVWQHLIITPWCPTVMMMLSSYLKAWSYHDDVRQHMMISSPYCCKEWGSGLGSALIILQPPSPKPPPRGHTQKIIHQITRIHKANLTLKYSFHGQSMSDNLKLLLYNYTATTPHKTSIKSTSRQIRSTSRIKPAHHFFVVVNQMHELCRMRDFFYDRHQR